MFAKMLDAFTETQRTALGMTAQAAALFDRFDSAEKLGSIEVPTMIIHGDEDRVMLPSNGLSLAKKTLASGASVNCFEDISVDLSRAGHFWWIQDPLEVAAGLGSFFRRTEK